MEPSIILLQERFKERNTEIKTALEEVESLLGCDLELIEKFYTFFVISHWGRNIEKLKKDQEVIREAKKINNKIAHKALELSELLNELEDICCDTQDIFPPRFSLLELINDAVKLNNKLDPCKKRATRQSYLYKKLLGNTVKRILKKEDPYEYYPDLSQVLHALHVMSEDFVFKQLRTKQVSPRAMIRYFMQNLVMAVESKCLPDEVLKISPDTIANLTNVALNLYDESLVSSDNARKVISEVLNH